MNQALPVRRFTALLCAMALATLTWMFSAPAEPAAALAPTQTAWWNVANQDGAPAVPPPPDVDTGKHDLYVQGAGDSGAPGLPGQAPPPPTGNAQGGVQALAAIHFVVPDGAAVQKLSLKLTGNKPPTDPTVVACPLVTPGFKSEDNGPVSDIPKYDCTNQVAGKMTASGVLEFTGIGKLVKGPELLLMLVPGKLDRVVFAHPDASALQVSSGYTASPTLAQVPPYTAPASTGAGTGSTGGAAFGPSTASSYNAPPLAVTPIGEPPLPAPLPTKAPAGGLARRILQGAGPAVISSRMPLSPQQTRLVVGAATLAAIAAFAFMVLLGPRMTAPASGAPADGGGTVRGIGRFARPRTGHTPRIW